MSQKKISWYSERSFNFNFKLILRKKQNKISLSIHLNFSKTSSKKSSRLNIYFISGYLENNWPLISIFYSSEIHFSSLFSELNWNVIDTKLFSNSIRKRKFHHRFVRGINHHNGSIQFHSYCLKSSFGLIILQCRTYMCNSKDRLIYLRFDHQFINSRKMRRLDAFSHQKTNFNEFFKFNALLVQILPKILKFLSIFYVKKLRQPLTTFLRECPKNIFCL